MDRWIMGIVWGLIAFVGLFMASRAYDDALYATGLVLFVIGVVSVFRQIAGAYDDAARRR